MIWNEVKRSYEEADGGIYRVDTTTDGFEHEIAIRVCETCEAPFPTVLCKSCGVFICTECDPATVMAYDPSLEKQPVQYKHACQSSD